MAQAKTEVRVSDEIRRMLEEEPGSHVLRAAADFHEKHPGFLENLVRFCRELKKRGIARYGIAGLFERVRWHYAVTHGSEPFKINNDYRSFFARLLMRAWPDEFDGFFETRRLRD